MNMNLSNIADILTVLAFLITIITLVNTFRILRQNKEAKKRLSQKVKIILKNYDADEERVLTGEITKSEVLRGEVMGRIGMIPRKDPKIPFIIKYVKSNEFLEQLKDVRESSDKDKIIITCSAKEMEQFDF